MFGIHGPNDFIHGARQFPGRVVNLIELAGSLTGGIQFAARGFAQHGDTGQMGAQIVMNVSRNAGALVLDVALVFDAFELVPHPPPGIEPDHAAAGSHEQHACQDAKPQRLPKKRQYLEINFCAGVVPNAVVIAGDDLKGIICRRNIIVIHHAPA